MEAFSQAVVKLTRWMIENKTHPNLVSVISEYTQGSGKTSYIVCTVDLPSIMNSLFCRIKLDWEIS